MLNDIDLEKELGDFIDIVKEETGCERIGKINKGTPFSFKIQSKKIDLLIEVIQS